MKSILLLLCILCAAPGIPLSGIIGTVLCQDNNPRLDVPFEPTHPWVVDAMLELADIKPSDILYDLGCGDGRIPIEVAKKYGILGTGIDIDPQRIREADENAGMAGVTGKVRFITADILEYDFSEASVVTLYLLSRINISLRPHLFHQLKPGSRVISHAFDMGYWEPDSTVRHPKARNNKIFLWIMPAYAGGDWYWTTGTPLGDITRWHVRLSQNFQGVVFRFMSPDYAPSSPGEALLEGTDLRFESDIPVNGKNVHIVYRGQVCNDTIRGTQQWSQGMYDSTFAWSAVRKPVTITGKWKGKNISPGSPGTEFVLQINKPVNGALSADFEKTGSGYHDIPFYSWGANIWFEVAGLTYTGFVNGDEINGLIRDGHSSKGKKWCAHRMK
ncbi:MAG: class I SAM-dependent methyltransferase [Bacteroidales bacterium]|nr:class I SAM-dependent methyltransferase [Bacteroidales bacterium]